MNQSELLIEELEKYIEVKDEKNITDQLAKIISAFDLYDRYNEEARKRFYSITEKTWQKWYMLLLKLIQWKNDQALRTAYHYIVHALRIEYEKKDKHIISSRLEMVLPILSKLLKKNPQLLLRFTDDLYFMEEPNETYNKWIKKLQLKTSNYGIPKTYFECVKIIYFYRRMSWEKAKKYLLAALDHKDNLVRAYAARILGEFYYNESSLSKPTLAEVISLIKQKELKQPGIAGPFISNYYHGELDSLEKEAKIDNIYEWIFEILEKRKGSEPNLLPCSNGIDFFAHELFDSPDYLKRLIKIGKIDIVDQSAQCNNIDLKPIWKELLTDKDPKIRKLAKKRLDIQ